MSTEVELNILNRFSILTHIKDLDSLTGQSSFGMGVPIGSKVFNVECFILDRSLEPLRTAPCHVSVALLRYAVL